MCVVCRSHLLLDLSGPLLNVVGVAVLVALYHTGYDYGLLPQGAPPLTTAWEPFNLVRDTGCLVTLAGLSHYASLDTPASIQHV